jgi:3-phenylpropionate/trans-cinnamate dioxygenase ferredoxin subunit
MADEWVDLGAAHEVLETERLSVEIDDVPLLIVRCGAELYAVENRCTHDGETLCADEIDTCEIDACEVVCPRHGARFCLRSGAALTPPAYEQLRTFRVRIADGRVLVERPA